jgi:RNA-binding protein NOB1
LESKLDDLILQSTEDLESATVEGTETGESPVAESSSAEAPSAETQDSDDEGWITPSNLKKHQAADASAGSTPAQPAQKTLQAAILTSDYAMQNVALRININLITPTFSRITHLKNWVLRCHGCFAISKEMDKQFCPKCGQPTLTRTSCSTDQNGNFQVHLKKNFQWNNRGNVYSVPKAVHGTANGRLPKGAGGKNGWGRELILAEDQKEFVRANEEQKRQRARDIMDEDYLPAILSGKRTGGGGKIRVGAGKNVNSKKKH